MYRYLFADGVSFFFFTVSMISFVYRCLFAGGVGYFIVSWGHLCVQVSVCQWCRVFYRILGSPLCTGVCVPVVSGILRYPEVIFVYRCLCASGVGYFTVS